METARLNFQFYAPLHARLVLLANRNEPPSFGLHQVFQVINDEILSSSSGAIQRRTIRESQLMQMQTRHELEHGSWYITILNDLDHSVSVVLNISVIHNESVSCTNNCNNNGHCHLGKCQCFPGFIGHDCADSKFTLTRSNQLLPLTADGSLLLYFILLFSGSIQTFVPSFVMDMVSTCKEVAVVKPTGKGENVRFERPNVRCPIVTEMAPVSMECAIVGPDLRENIVNKVYPIYIDK